MNTLKNALKKRGISMCEASRKGIPLTTIVKHCNGNRQIGVMATLRYEELLGIPRSELRPDIWPPRPEDERHA